MAVPSLMSPRAAMSVRTFCKRLSSEAWSVVIGHWVKASPANIDKPMLSLGRPMINSDATALAASIRLGLRSSASILVETSMASIMSMPSTDLFFHELLVCGRAITITMSVNVTMRNSSWSGISLTRQLFGA